MKKFLLGFAEGYFVVSIILYIATYLIMKKYEWELMDHQIGV